MDCHAGFVPHYTPLSQQGRSDRHPWPLAAQNLATRGRKT
jgi:hypothetical protein